MRPAALCCTRRPRGTPGSGAVIRAKPEGLSGEGHQPPCSRGPQIASQLRHRMGRQWFRTVVFLEHDGSAHVSTVDEWRGAPSQLGKPVTRLVVTAGAGTRQCSSPSSDRRAMTPGPADICLSPLDARPNGRLPRHTRRDSCARYGYRMVDGRRSWTVRAVVSIVRPQLSHLPSRRMKLGSPASVSAPARACSRLTSKQNAKHASQYERGFSASSNLRISETTSRAVPAIQIPTGWWPSEVEGP